MQQIDLFRPYIATNALRSVVDVLSADDDGRVFIGQGPLVDRFESVLSRLLEVTSDRVITTNSCTSALDLALHLCGVGPGDEVVTSPQTCTATNGVIVNRGARIVWADISPTTGLIDPADVARKITPRTKAIVAVDWGGHPCDYDALRAHGIPVIEDAAHAFLTRYKGFSIAARGGDYVCYSFGPIKHLTCGDGGALITPLGEDERARLLRWHGLSRTSSADFRCAQTIQEAGYKYHLTDFNAAVGLANAQHIDRLVARHRHNAAWFNRALANLPGITLPPHDPDCAYWLYTLVVEDRDGLIAYLKEKGIAASPVHARNDRHPAYHFPNGPLPGVNAFSSSNVAIPVGWWVDDLSRERIANALTEWAYSERKAVAA